METSLLFGDFVWIAIIVLCIVSIFGGASGKDSEKAPTLTELEESFLPSCPKCGKKLKTPNAKQCFSCGADWHEPA